MLKGRGKGRRGQVTIFIILGLVLVVVFSFALFARGLLSAGKLQQEAQNILTDALETSSVTYYVESCLEQVSTEALITLGKQGGKLRMRPGIPGADYYILNKTGRITDVNYGLVPNTFCAELSSTSAPDYPRRNTEISRFTSIYNGGSCRYILTSGFLGQMGFDPLCSATGANNKENSGGWNVLACPVKFISSTEYNTQTLLEQHISKTLPLCTDFSFYEDLFGHNITMPEADQLDSVVTYGFDSLTIDATFPFIVQVGKRTVKTYHNFSFVSPIPYREIYTYAADLVAEEARNITFNISQDYKKVSSYRSSFNVTFIEDPCFEPWSGHCQDSMLYDDIFIIKDENTIVGGSAYEFVFALKNRIPVLDYIHTTETDSNFDIKIKENETLLIRPEGFDPDGKNVSYFYTGWKEDYDEVMDITCCMAANDRGDVCYADETCYDIHHNQPHNWSTSNLFVRTHQEASINLSSLDMGKHYLQVYIYEDSELYDYQNISILVFDLPTAVANTSNGFDDIDNYYASMEDPYFLNASSSIASMVMGGAESSIYDWIIIKDGKRIGRFDTPNADDFTLPNEAYNFYQVDLSGALLEYPGEGFFQDITFALFNDTGIHVLELRTSSDAGDSPIYSEPANVTMEVLECLPHRDPYDSYSMYPYNRTHETSFDYSHTCCSNETGSYGTILEADETGPCYEEDYYGMMEFLRPYDALSNSQGIRIYRDMYNYNLPVYTNDVSYGGAFSNLEDIEDFLSHPEDPAYNDVYHLQVRRYCGGNRGNVCGGPIELEYSLQTIPSFGACGGEISSLGQDERCGGPPVFYIPRLKYRRTYPLHCTYYGSPLSENPVNNAYPLYSWRGIPESTFEELTHSLYRYDSGQDNFPEADGFCINEDRCFPTEGAPGYLTGGVNLHPGTQGTPLLCQGGCESTTGTCNLPLNCTCSMNDCNAECEIGGPLAQMGEYNICLQDCQEDTCLFGNRNHFCPDFCVTFGAEPENISGTLNCRDEHNYEPFEYTAYFGGEGACQPDDPCDWTEDKIQTLEEGYCYYCDEHGCNDNDGSRERCETYEEGTTCYYQADSQVNPYCDEETCHGLTDASRPACWPGVELDCIDTGWTPCPQRTCYHCDGATLETSQENYPCPGGWSPNEITTCP